MVARARVLGLLVAVLGVCLCGSAQASPLAPEVSVGQPTGVGTAEATLRARVNPEGQATTYRFEYGPTTGYGTNVPVSDGEVGSGDVSVAVSGRPVGLSPGTTYHYRIVATNATGTITGADATFATYPASVEGGGCSNELRREEQNVTYLPDCRAYEMVSPIDKNGTDVTGSGQIAETSTDGQRLVYAAEGGFGETNGSGGGGYTQYIASREASGWTSHGITPTPPQDSFQLFIGTERLRWVSEDLRYVMLEGYALPGVPGAIPKGINDYREATTDGSLEAVTTSLTESVVEPSTMNFALRGSSSDLGVATFETKADLLPQTTGGESKLYAWNHGELTLAGILPDGSLPAAGSSTARSTTREVFPPQAPQEDADTLSRDGSRIAFASPAAGGEPQLYLRRDGTSTAWIDESEGSVPVAEPKKVVFQTMAPDGRQILFTTSDRLLDADPGGEGVALYMYTDGPSPASESNLTFIARVEQDFQAQNFTVAAISEDASRVYFYTEAAPGFLQTGTYLWDKGSIHFVASTKRTLAYGERFVEASSDGRELAFEAPEQLTSAPVGTSLGAMYVYDEKDESLRCVSCLPTGLPTMSAVQMAPNATNAFAGLYPSSKPRFISSDGRYVFFATADALVPRDVNGLYDVYEYDSLTGRVSLLSSGSGENGVWFSASSANGDDAFVVTRESLVGSDADTLADFYDIRVNGGFPQPKPLTGGCDGDECQGTPGAAPSFNTASGFSGLGNISSKATGEIKPKTLTRAQKLARALKVCKRKQKKARRRCEAQAKKRYGAEKSRKSTSNRSGR